MTQANYPSPAARLHLQSQLDAGKTQAERNKLGQFATPATLANAIIKTTQAYWDRTTPIRFLDPAFGTGAFYEALKTVYNDADINAAHGIEIDPHYGKPAQTFWQPTKLKLTFADFTQLPAPQENDSKPNVIVCNPPYVRHHHIDSQQKQTLRGKIRETTGINLSGLAGLYCYFLLLAHDWMAEGGLGCWLIPGEFLDVNYGQAVKQYLLDKVTLLRIHRFDPTDTQFDDALVSSVVVWFRNTRPNPENAIKFTVGGKPDRPHKTKLFLHKQLDSQTKWSNLFRGNKNRHRTEPILPEQIKISDLFHIKRGVATGANKFFILTPEQIQRHHLPPACFVPVLPSPRYLDSTEILADEHGRPKLQKSLFLLNCRLSEEEIYATYPALWQYLETGKAQAIHERYLCRHRTPWYSQESRLPAPILCTYMGRNADPFKFILNHSKAIAPNVYLMLYPKKSLQTLIKATPDLLTRIWRELQDLQSTDLIREGRVYGGGLFKLEPKELGNASLKHLDYVLPAMPAPKASQLSLL